MTQRKEVFQSKVLQKLYPAAAYKLEESIATPHLDALAKKTAVKRAIQGHSSGGNTSTAVKRVYTVLPPPADYKTNSEISVPHSEPVNLLSAEDPDENSADGSSDQPAEEPEEKKRRRRRRKRKDAALTLNQTAVNEGEERLSKNKKRKLKKKRHKEKLLSMGLVPRTAAIEFTFQRDRSRPAEGEEEEGGSQSNEPSQDQGGHP